MTFDEWVTLHHLNKIMQNVKEFSNFKITTPKYNHISYHKDPIQIGYLDHTTLKMNHQEGEFHHSINAVYISSVEQRGVHVLHLTDVPTDAIFQV